MAVGFAGLVVGAMSPKWRSVGETSALIGIGAPLVLGTIGLTKSTISQAETPAELPPGPQVYQIDSTNNGQSFAVNVGDTINLILDSTLPAPTVTPTGILTAGASSATPANSDTSTTSATTTTTTYPYTVAAAGTATLTSTDATSGSTDSFTMTVVAS
jgi:hypothetical protein